VTFSVPSPVLSAVRASRGAFGTPLSEVPAQGSWRINATHTAGLTSRGSSRGKLTRWLAARRVRLDLTNLGKSFVRHKLTSVEQWQAFVLTLGALASVVGAVLSWTVKLRWSEEERRTKDDRIALAGELAKFREAMVAQAQEVVKEKEATIERLTLLRADNADKIIAGLKKINEEYVAQLRAEIARAENQLATDTALFEERRGELLDQVSSLQRQNEMHRDKMQDLLEVAQANENKRMEILRQRYPGHFEERDVTQEPVGSGLTDPRFPSYRVKKFPDHYSVWYGVGPNDAILSRGATREEAIQLALLKIEASRTGNGEQR
jgi:hypothetical protein